MSNELVQQVMRRVQDMQDNEGLRLPSGYSASNALNSAWLILTDDSKGPSLLTKCEPNSSIVENKSKIMSGWTLVRKAMKPITIEEFKTVAKPKVVLTWAPHPKALPQAVANSFAEWMNQTEYEFVITHPKGYELSPDFVGNAKVEYNQERAFEGADFIYAKNWSVFNDGAYGTVQSIDRSWMVDESKMQLTNNARFMHCLPVRRNMIVSDGVIESEASIVTQQAANRVVSAQVVLKEMLLSL